VFRFPFLQRFVIATFGFDDFTGVRIFVDLHLTRFAAADFRLGCWSATASMRIEQVNYVRQAVTVFSQQCTQLRFEFDFFLEASIVFQGFEGLELFGEVFFELTVFCELGDDESRLVGG